MNWKINSDVGLYSKDFVLDDQQYFGFKKVSNEVIREKLLSSMFEKIIDPDSDVISDNLIGIEDYDIFPMSEWDQAATLRARATLRGEVGEFLTGDVETNFRIRLENIKDVSEISQVKVELGFIDYEDKGFQAFHTTRLTVDGSQIFYAELDGERDSLKSQYTFKVRSQFVPLSVIKDAVEDDKRLAIRIKDFEYTKKGKKLLYSRVLDDVNDKTARVIISDPHSMEMIHIVPRAKVLDGMISVRSNVKLSTSGQVLGASTNDNVLANTLFINDTDLHSLKPDELHLGLWKTIPLGFHSSDLMVEGNVYSLVYGEAKQIVSSLKDRVDFDFEGVDKREELFHYSFDDEIYIEIDAVEALPVQAVGTREATFRGKSCIPGPPSRGDLFREIDRNSKAEICTWMEYVCNISTFEVGYKDRIVELSGQNFSEYLALYAGDFNLKDNKFIDLLGDRNSLLAKIKVGESLITKHSMLAVQPNVKKYVVRTGYRSNGDCNNGLKDAHCIKGCGTEDDLHPNKISLDIRARRSGNKHQ
jgi:hypothetical protein